MSMRIGSFSDHIEFSKADNGSLAETYYIAIYGYAYASYSVLAHINREGESIEDKLKSSITHLYEGVPLQKSLHNEFD